MDKTIENSFESTLKDSNLSEVTTDFAEVSLDSILDEGILKDIPIVKVFVNLTKLGLNIHDRLFLKKIIYFIKQIAVISTEERMEMIDEIDNSRKYRVKVGEKLLYIIDSSNDYENTELVGLLFKAFLEKKITYREFLKCAEIIKKINPQDLDWFLYRATTNMEPQEAGELVGSGLFVLKNEELDIHVDDQDDWKDTNKYKTSVNGGAVSVDISRAGTCIKKILFSQEKFEMYKKNQFGDLYVGT